MSRSLYEKRGAVEGVGAVEGTIRLLLFEAPPQDLQSAFNCYRILLRDSGTDRIDAGALFFDIPFAEVTLVPLHIESPCAPDGARSAAI